MIYIIDDKGDGIVRILTCMRILLDTEGGEGYWEGIATPAGMRRALSEFKNKDNIVLRLDLLPVEMGYMRRKIVEAAKMLDSDGKRVYITLTSRQYEVIKNEAESP